VTVPLFWFSEIVARRGGSVERTRIVRHDRRGLAHWSSGEDRFEGFASYQSLKNSPFNGAKFVFQFVPGPPLPGGEQTALFVGAHRILDRWVWDGTRLPRLHHPDFAEDATRNGIEAFDLEPLSDWRDLSERVLVRWGPAASTRSWSQWLKKNDKEVLEFRLKAAQPPFPGFDAFSTTFDELPFLPQSWRETLAAVAGVYVLTCPDTGDLYVGSATGGEGFLQRWLTYARDGHGGNIILKKRGRRNYRIGVLQIASTQMSPDAVLALESCWKHKLGSRAHGLNSN
jgi:hypothetical protein